MDSKARCNDLFECPDDSDEQNCEPILINKNSYRNVMPHFLKDQKNEIKVTAELHSIKDIDQLAMTFLGELKIILHWKDARITFKDLGPNGSYLNDDWKKQIWLPPLYFSNTVEKLPIYKDDGYTVKILREAKHTVNDISELNEGCIFNGDENHLQLTSHYEYTFHCTFNLSKFPFDTQHCHMILKVPSEMREFVKLKPNKTLIFRGKDLL